MASTICGHCGRYSHMTDGTAAWTRREGGAKGDLTATFKCDQCNTYIAALSPRGSGDSGATVDTARAQRKDTDWRWFPQGTETRHYVDVPHGIASVASEAHACASIGSHTGAILLARTVVEATAKDQGVKTGNLVSKIDALKDKNLIRPGIAEAAHEIRHLGNDMAHGDLDDAPDHDDAEDVLALMAQVLSEVYQGPALVAKVRARRGAAAE